MGIAKVERDARTTPSQCYLTPPVVIGRLSAPESAMMLLWLLAILLAESSAVTPAKMRPQLAALQPASTLNRVQLPVTSARSQDAVPDSSRESSSTDAVLVDDVAIMLLAWRQTDAFDSENPDNLMLDLDLDLTATDLALDLAAIDMAGTTRSIVAASAAIVGRLRGGESRVEEGVNLARLADACMHIARSVRLLSLAGVYYLVKEKSSGLLGVVYFIICIMAMDELGPVDDEPRKPGVTPFHAPFTRFRTNTAPRTEM